MKNLYKQKRQEGFTIIEVMIVLAIAAVILLIVLLAVPALQRNSRNTQRNNDAAQIAAAVNTCLTNQNGNPALCQNQAVGSVDIDTSKLGQLSTPVPAYSGTGAFPANNTSATWTFGYRCLGNVPTSGAASRAITIQFKVETTGADQNRCIEG
jgi:prepilin-type N-terminal cleavage/methylation domain-containing protein